MISYFYGYLRRGASRYNNLRDLTQASTLNESHLSCTRSAAPVKPMSIPTCGNLWEFIAESYLSNTHCMHNPVVYYLMLCTICIFFLNHDYLN